MCYCDDLDPPRFHSERTYRARKKHTCCECGRAIAPGTEYVAVTGLWDGIVERFKICRHCDAIRSLLESDDMCAPYTMLVECAAEYLNEQQFFDGYSDAANASNEAARDFERRAAEHQGTVGGFLYGLRLAD